MIAAAGQNIGGVVLTHEIAEGGMGSVWAGEHVALGREVVVKFLSESRLVDLEARQRFAMEGRTMARIHSPYVPQVFDQGECTDGSPFMVMERLDGIHLGAWVTRYGQMDLRQLAQLLDHVGSGLAAAHELGIVHRDVKPENIIVSGGPSDFIAKLIDFGIAKSLVHLPSSPVTTLTGTTVGTASYMSPEQVRSSTGIDERSDVWSLAVVAYWCLTGQLPFVGDTYAHICLAIHRGHFTSVCELRSDLPAGLDGWFHKALACDVDRRFSSTAAMSKMFKVAAASATGGALPVTPSLLPLAMEAIDAAFLGVAHTAHESAGPPTKRARPRKPMFAVGSAVLGLSVAVALSLAPFPIHFVPAESSGVDHVMRVTLATPTPGVLDHAVESPTTWVEASVAPLPPPDIPATAVSLTTPPASYPPRARRTVVTQTTMASGARHSGAAASREVTTAKVSAASPVPATSWTPTDVVGEP